MEAVILLGAPGAGKGTVAEDIKARLQFIHVSTGDMLREAIKAGRPLGVQAKAYMDRGELVPDELIVGLVTERMEQGSPNDRYLLDGFPRTTRQADMLETALSKYSSRVTHVFLLEVARSLLIERLSGRRICRQCGAVYHMTNMPPKKEGVCDQCGGEIYQRPDDNATTVANRLDVFANQTAGLISYYEQKGLLRRVDSTDRLETEEEIVRIVLGDRE